MVNSELNIIKVVSALPGRLRVNVRGLFRNEKVAVGIRNVLTKSNDVLYIHASKYTGNVLIYYNAADITEDKIMVLIEKALNHSSKVVIPENIGRQPLLKIILDMLNPVFLIRRKYSEEIYKNEYSISRKMLKTSIGIVGIILLFTSNISSAISTLILGYPGILFAVGAASYNYASVKLKQYNIYLKNNDSLSFLNNIDTMLIENDVLQSRFSKHNITMKHLDRYGIRKLVILRKMDNLVNKDIEIVINNIRILGINNIYLIGNSTNGIVDYISYFLGIKILDINYLENKSDCLIINDTKGRTILITTDEFCENHSVYSHCDLIICLYKNNPLNLLKSDISLEYYNIDKLPLLIKLSYFCREVNVQTQNIAITLNTVGMLLATLDYLTPLYSIVFYLLNTLLMTLTLKQRFESYKNFNKISNIKYNL